MRKRGKIGPATRLLAESPDDELAMSVITRGELAKGFDRLEAWQGFCADFLVHPLDGETLWRAAILFNDLRRQGVSMSDNDLWIAATALRHDLRILTENQRHFDRVPGLKLRTYERNA